MSTYDWPSGLEPAACALVLEPNVREFISPFTGTYEVLDLIGERWRLSLSFPPSLRATAAAHEAYFNKLRGIHTVRALHFDRPEPLGTARGTITLSSSAAQGASSLAITGATASTNLLVSSSFEIDTNVDGIADSWDSYANGATGSVTNTRPAGNGSTYAQRASAAGLGSASTDRVGYRTTSRVTGVLPGVAHTFALDVTGSSGATLQLQIVWYTSGDVLISADLSDQAQPTSWSRVSLTATAPATAAKAFLYVWAHTKTGGPAAHVLDIDNASFNAGTATTWPGFPTLLAGDMLGSSGQLFQVAADITLSDAGAGTVSVANRVRTLISSSTAVTWSRPTAVFRVAGGPPRALHAGGFVQLSDVDLIETF